MKFIQGSNNVISQNTGVVTVIGSNNKVYYLSSEIAFINSSGCTADFGTSGTTMINCSGCITHPNANRVTLINCTGVITDVTYNYKTVINNVKQFQGSTKITASTATAAVPAQVNGSYAFYYIDESGGDVYIQLGNPADFKDTEIVYKRITTAGNKIYFITYGSEKIEFVAGPQILCATTKAMALTSDGIDWFKKYDT